MSDNYQKQHAQPNQTYNLYLKLMIFQETQQESRSQNRWIKTPKARYARYAHPSARIPAVFELPLNESSNLGRKTTNSETPQKNLSDSCYMNCYIAPPK